MRPCYTTRHRMPKYSPQLDGLRYILFLMVFTYHHYFREKALWYLPYSLPVFFVLSGFLITNILMAAEGQNRIWILRQFYIRRFLRIFPAYYLILIAATAFGTLPWSVSQFFYFFNVKVFFLSQAGNFWEMLSPREWAYSGIHFWSLSVEEQYYLLFPLCFLFCARKQRGNFIVLGILLSIVFRFILMRSMPNAFYGALLPTCAEYFLWGSLAAYYESRRVLDRVQPDAVLWGSLFLSVVYIILHEPHSMDGQFRPVHEQSYFAPMMAAFIWGLWKSDGSVLAKLLRRPLLVNLGKATYGMYLIHIFVFGWVNDLNGRFSALRAIPFWFSTLAVTMLLALISWRYFERPINDLKRLFPYHRKSSEPEELADGFRVCT